MHIKHTYCGQLRKLKAGSISLEPFKKPDILRQFTEQYVANVCTSEYTVLHFVVPYPLALNREAYIINKALSAD